MKQAVKVAIIVVAIGVVLTGGYFLFKKQEIESPTPPSKPEQEQPIETTSPEESATPTSKLSELKKIYQGFKTAKKGDWAEWKIIGEEGNPIIKYVFVGEDIIDGKRCYGFELSGAFQQFAAAGQIWFSKEDNLPIKYVAKTPQGVFCLPPINYKVQEEATPSPTTPEEYKPESIIDFNYEIGSFTTESGKTIKVVKIYKEDQEVWVSSQVPFGMVKIISEGKTRLELKDFGSGAPTEITKEERENCRFFPMGGM